MRLLGWLVFLIGAIVIVALSVANRHVVVVNAMPDLTRYGAPAAPRYELPLFAVALATGAVGFLIGVMREYVREARHRRRLDERSREIAALRRELESVRSRQKLDEDDEIIALTAR